MKCEICNTYEGSNQQVAAHRVHCKKRHEANAEQPARTREEPARSERVSFGTPEKRLDVPDDKDFQYRVFNDGWAKEPGRIQRAKKAGYEIDETFTPIPVGTNEDGSPIMGVRMKIPREFYEEDQKKKQKEVDRVDQAIKSGTIEQQAGDKRYIPDGIKIWSSNNANQ